MKNRYKPDYTVHPGEILAEHIGINSGKNPFSDAILVSGFAKRTSISRLQLELILQGKTPITEQIAKKLGVYTNYSEKMWLNLQANYDTNIIRLNKWYYKLWKRIKGLWQN